MTLRGGVAHLGERLHGMQEVRGSIPLISTTKTGLQCSPVFLLLFSLFLQQKSARHKMPCAFYVAYSASSQKALKVR